MSSSIARSPILELPSRAEAEDGGGHGQTKNRRRLIAFPLNPSTRILYSILSAVWVLALKCVTRRSRNDRRTSEPRVYWLGVMAGRSRRTCCVRGTAACLVAPRRVDAAAGRGRRASRASAADVARGAEVVFSMASDAPDVEQIALGAQGVIGVPDAGPYLRRHEHDCTAGGRVASPPRSPTWYRHADAPAAANPVTNAALTILVGGSLSAFERVHTAVRLLGEVDHVHRSSGVGQIAKACTRS